jgi:hypothetical protein
MDGTIKLFQGEMQWDNNSQTLDSIRYGSSSLSVMKKKRPDIDTCSLFDASNARGVWHVMGRMAA